MSRTQTAGFLLALLSLLGCGEATQAPEAPKTSRRERHKKRRKKSPPKFDQDKLTLLTKQLLRNPSVAPYITLEQPLRVKLSAEEQSVLRRAGRILAVGTPRKQQRLPLLLAAGEQPNPLIRRRGILMIEARMASASMHRNNSLPLLVDRLADKDPNVAIAAALRLADIPDSAPKVIAALGRTLRSEKRMLRIATLHALAAAGPRATWQLLQGLRDPDPRIAALAEMSLRKLTPPAALADKFAAALTDSHPEVRYNAAKLLCRMGKRISQTKAALRGGINKHPREALVLLARTDIDDAALTRLMFDALLGQTQAGRAVIAAVLETGRSSALLLALLVQTINGEDAVKRIKALEGLIGIGQPAAPALIGALTHPDAAVRTRAGQALGSMGGRAAPSLLQALGKGSAAARLAAAMALARTQTTEARKSIPTLLTALTHPMPRTRIEAAKLLGVVARNDVRTGARLVRAGAKDKTLRSVIAAALRSWSESARLRLYDALGSGAAAYERWTAFRGWAALKKYDKLIGLLADSDPLLVRAVKRALLSGSERDKTGEALLRGLTHSRPAIRVESAYTLLSLKPSRKFGSRKIRQAIPVLVTTLGGTDLKLRKRALTRLSKISPVTGQIIFALGQRVAEETDSELAELAARTLKAHGTKARRAIGPLSRGLRSSRVSVRRRVLYALAAIGRAARKQIQWSAKREQDPAVKNLANDLLKQLK